MNKLLLKALLPLLLCQSWVYADASLETNVCLENKSKQNVGARVVGYSPPQSWDGSAHQAQGLNWLLFPGQTHCTRLELPITTSDSVKPYIKLTLNRGAEVYLEGGTGHHMDSFEKDNGIRWRVFYENTYNYDNSLIGQYYPDEAPMQKREGDGLVLHFSDATTCNKGKNCNKFIIPEEFDRPYK